jgi:hypothetical protein
MIRRSLFLLAILSLLALSFAFAKGGDMSIMTATASILFPSWGEWYNYTVDYFNWSEDLSLGSATDCSYILNGNSASFSCVDKTVGLPSVQEDTNVLSITIKNAFGQQATDTVTFHIDTISPDITIDSPTATEYPNKVDTINYTLVETNPDSCWFSQNGGANQNFDCTFGSITVPESIEGNNTWTICANDTVGHQDCDSVTFLKDTIYPQVQITYPVNNERYGSVVTHVDFTINETNPNTCWFNDGTTTTNFDCSLNTLSQSSNENWNTWTVCINDTVNHENCSSVTFWVDSIIPKIEFLDGTTENGNYSHDYISVEVWANDTNLDALEINLYDSAGIVRSTIEHASGIYSFDISGLPDGTYYLNATVNDSIGHSGSTETRTVTLDTVAPVINLTAPDNSQPFAQGSDVTIDFSVTETNLKQCMLNLNGIPQAVTPTTKILSGLSSGKYDWSISCEDYSGNSAGSETRTFTLLSDLTFPPGTEYPNLTLEPDISSVWFWVRNEFGMINWTQPLDLSRGANWADFINLSFNHAGVNSTAAPELNSAAVITLNNLTWTSPRILKDNGACSDCLINSYASGILSFNINSFSFYETIETPKESFSSSGGSSCTTNWTCTEWNLCIGNMQTRTCTKARDYCNAITIKPEEKQSCIEQKSVNKTVEQVPSQEEAAQPEQQPRAGITGFVIAHPASTAATLIALLGLTSYFVVSKIRARNAKPDIKDEKKEGVTWISGKSAEKVKDI